MSYHTAGRWWGRIDVWRLIAMINNAVRSGTLGITTIPVSKLQPSLSRIHWEDSMGFEFPAGELVNRTSNVSVHWNRIYGSSDDPIIVFEEKKYADKLRDRIPEIWQSEWEPVEIDLIDGLHRLWKLILGRNVDADVYVVPYEFIESSLFSVDKSMVTQSRMNRMSRLTK